MAQQPLVGLGLLIIEASRSHSDTPQSIGFLRMSDQPDAGTSTCTAHNTHRRQTSLIPASEQPQTHALERAATGIGNYTYAAYIINPLKTKRICFIQGLNAYRAVNTLHFGYKNQSLNVL
jgi:hypothetical protein